MGLNNIQLERISFLTATLRYPLYDNQAYIGLASCIMLHPADGVSNFVAACTYRTFAFVSFMLISNNTSIKVFSANRPTGVIKFSCHIVLNLSISHYFSWGVAFCLLRLCFPFRRLRSHCHFRLRRTRGHLVFRLPLTPDIAGIKCRVLAQIM